jgi:hypothetical protein
MDSVKFEEAQRCPRCDVVGEITSTRSGPDRSKIHVLTCQNSRCSWFETDWVVQQLEDGTVPLRDTGSRTQKTFPEIPGMTTEKAVKQVKKIADDAPRDRS